MLLAACNQQIFDITEFSYNRHVTTVVKKLENAAKFRGILLQNIRHWQLPMLFFVSKLRVLLYFIRKNKIRTSPGLLCLFMLTKDTRL
jgi:hypothetical protein